MDRRSVYTLAALAGFVVVSAALFGRSPEAAAGARVPSRDDEVLEKLPAAKGNPRTRELDELRRNLAANPNDVGVAIRVAEMNIALWRERSDPRYLGRAQAALGPFWTAEDAPERVLVLRATIKQSLHDFEPALVDLDRAVAREPRDRQAWLTRAVVLMVRGRYDEARASCEKLRELAAPIVTLACTTQVQSLTGSSREAFDELARAVDAPGLPPELESWARSLLGEYAERLGDDKAAVANLERALALDPEDSYSRGALADIHLDQGRYDEAIKLLAGRESNDAMLLRLAIAETKAKRTEAAEHTKTLAERMEASALRGDVVHRREAARYYLELDRQPARALKLAKENWEVQKEPWDARLVLEAAKAADAPKEAEGVLAWLRTTKLEHPVIARLVKELTR